MRKFLVYVVPVLLLLISVLIMHSVIILKHPMHETDDFAGYLRQVHTNIQKGDWEQAGVDCQKLQTAWRQVINRIQFSVEKDEISRLSANLARLDGAIEARDKGGALMEIYEAEEFWQELGF